MVYSKTVLYYPGRPWPKRQRAHCSVFQYGWVPSKKQCHCAQTSNDTYVKYWNKLKACIEDNESAKTMNLSSLLSQMYSIAASIANSSSVQIEASSIRHWETARRLCLCLFDFQLKTCKNGTL